MDTHGALTTEELDSLYGYDNVLSPLIKEATNAFSRLTLPASANPPTSTLNLSHILGADSTLQTTAPMPQQLLPGSVSLPPPGIATAGMVPLQAQKPYKPYKEQDYPHFSGVVEEFGGWRREWMQKILPWISEEVALWEMNRCTPKNLDLSIYDKVEDVWQELGRLYGNPLTISSSVMENFLDMRPSDVPGETEESQLAHLEKTLYRLNKRLGKVDEVHQLIRENAQSGT